MHAPLLLLSLTSLTATFASPTSTTTDSTSYKYLDYDNIVAELHSFHKEHPQLTQLNNAQAAFNVTSPGKCGAEPCRQWYFSIQQSADLSLPEVFFSGCVHGNERIGPTTTVEVVRLLLNNVNQPNNKDSTSVWLSRLVRTRVITIMPTANALGYYKNVREENGIDPNRDFPWGVSEKECMQTTAARALNSLFRERMFQLSITFHSGMRAIAYEWGSPNYKDASPDDGALHPIGRHAVRAAGVGDGENHGYYYPEGVLNPLVYPVKGGMEDWAYAASFDTTGYSVPCKPTTYGGYSEELTKYDSNMLRTFNILVETADDKIPKDGTLGETGAQDRKDLVNLNVARWSDGGQQIIVSDDDNNNNDDDVKRKFYASDGHIPRNIRLALYIIDIVEPYLEWFVDEKNEDPLVSELVGMRFRWDVGGALHVDDTALFVVALPRGAKKCPRNLDGLSLDGGIRMDVMSKESVGPTIWGDSAKERVEGEEGLKGGPTEGDKLVQFVGRYVATLKDSVVSELKQQWSVSTLVLFAGAMVDQSWSTPEKSEYEPKGLAPQSLLVQARTKDGWSAKNGKRRVDGHLWWYSAPRCLGDLGGGGGSGGGGRAVERIMIRGIKNKKGNSGGRGGMLEGVVN